MPARPRTSITALNLPESRLNLPSKPKSQVKYARGHQGVIDTPYRGLIPPPNFRTTPPALYPDTPQYLTGGVECYFYSPHLWHSSTLILHSLCIIKHDRNVLLKRFFSGINVTLYFSFQPPGPHRGSASGPHWETFVPQTP